MEVIHRQSDWLDAKSVLRNQIFLGVSLCFWVNVSDVSKDISVFMFKGHAFSSCGMLYC